MSKPAFPNTITESLSGERNFPHDFGLHGLTCRELFAAMAMQGLCSALIVGKHNTGEEHAQLAVKYADLLIAELDK